MQAATVSQTWPELTLLEEITIAPDATIEQLLLRGEYRNNTSEEVRELEKEFAITHRGLRRLCLADCKRKELKKIKERMAVMKGWRVATFGDLLALGADSRQRERIQGFDIIALGSLTRINGIPAFPYIFSFDAQPVIDKVVEFDLDLDLADDDELPRRFLLAAKQNLHTE